MNNPEILKPLQFCKGCGINVEFYQCVCVEETKYSTEPVKLPALSIGCFEGAHQASYPSEQNTVAIVARCELGENCRCRPGDEPGCWNWPQVIEK